MREETEVEVVFDLWGIQGAKKKNLKTKRPDRTRILVREVEVVFDLWGNQSAADTLRRYIGRRRRRRKKRRKRRSKRRLAVC